MLSAYFENLKFVVLFLFVDNFADYKRLRGGVYFVDSLPLTPSGKVRRQKVKEMLIELYQNENGEAES